QKRRKNFIWLSPLSVSPSGNWKIITESGFLSGSEDIFIRQKQGKNFTATRFTLFHCLKKWRKKSETGIHWASSGSEAVLPSEHGFFLPLSPGVRLPFPI